MAKNKDFFDYNTLLRTYLSKWYLFAVSVVVCVGLMFVYTKMKPDVYEIHSNVLVAGDGDQMPGMGALSVMFSQSGQVDDELFILSSRTVLRDAVKALKINKEHYVKTGLLTKQFAYPDFPIDVQASEELVDTLSTGITFKIKVNEKGLASVKAKAKKETIADVEDQPLPLMLKTAYGRFVVDSTATFPHGEEVKATVTLCSYDDAAEALSQEIVADSYSRKSNVLNLLMQTINTDYGKDVLNKVMEMYNVRGVEQQNAKGEKTAEFINRRLDLIAADLDHAEIELQDFKKKERLIDVGTEAQYQTTRRGTIDKELFEAEVQNEMLKVTRDFVSDHANEYNVIPTNVEDGPVQSAIAQYNSMVLRRINLLRAAKPDNLVIKTLEEQLTIVRKNLISTVNKALENSEFHVNELRKEMASTSSKLSDIPVQEREYRNMARQQQVKQQLYIYLLQRREENSMILANALPKGIIVDEAYTMSEPVGMSRKMKLALALLFGLLIPPACIYIRRLLRNKFDTLEEVEQMTDIPILGEISKSHSGKTLVATKNSTSSNAELFRLLRTNLQFMLGMLDKRVLLIGVDIRKPRLAQYLDLQPKAGLVNFLISDNVTVGDLIIKASGERIFDIITAGPVPPNPAELLTSKRLDELIDSLRQNYDYILLDSAPVGMVSDSFTIDRLCYSTVYVCRAGLTLRRDISYANTLYEEGRLKKMSLVVNGTASKKGYGYGYGENQH